MLGGTIEARLQNAYLCYSGWRQVFEFQQSNDERYKKKIKKGTQLSISSNCKYFRPLMFRRVPIHPSSLSSNLSNDVILSLLIYWSSIPDDLFVHNEWSTSTEHFT